MELIMLKGRGGKTIVGFTTQKELDAYKKMHEELLDLQRLWFYGTANKDEIKPSFSGDSSNKI